MTKYMDLEMAKKLKEALGQKMMSSKEIADFIGHPEIETKSALTSLITRIQNEGILIYEEKFGAEVKYGLLNDASMDQYEEQRRKSVC